MAGGVLDISKESARVLHNRFTMGFQESGLPIISNSDSMSPMTTLCNNDILVTNRVIVDKATAKYPATDTTLRLLTLEQSQLIHIHDTLLEMAQEKSIKYTTKLASNGCSTKDNAQKAEQALQIVKEIKEWLDESEGNPYTNIVDGANVAYFSWGKVNVCQLIHMVDALVKQGGYLLVVFPEKYTWRK